MSLGLLPVALIALVATGAMQPRAGSLIGTGAGVRLEVRPQVPHPRPLSRPLVALFVVVENSSDKAVVIESSAFEIATPGGRRYAALRPDALRRSPASSAFAEPAIALSALPQDPLGSGARAEGFLYFDEIEEPGPWTLRFTVRGRDQSSDDGVIAVVLPSPPP